METTMIRPQKRYSSHPSLCYNPRMTSKKQKAPSRTIAAHRRARHDYHIEENLEAGLVLQGWEVKSLRAGRANLSESYAIIRRGEAWLIGGHISPLSTISTHVHADPTRSRKLLLKQRELRRLIGLVQRDGYTLVPLSLYWGKSGHAKLDVGLAKGKRKYDKRHDQKTQDWNRQRERALKNERR